MPELGKLNDLTVLRPVEHGLILDGLELGEILLPRRFVLSKWSPGDTIEVFLLRDSEDRLVASTAKPIAMVDEFACLKVISVTAIGAFLDWGLSKDLLVPFREQKVKMLEGRSYVVRIYLDQVSGRIAASSKLDKFLDQTEREFATGDAVKLMICDRTDIGFRAIVDESHWGMLFFDNAVEKLERGQRVDGYILSVRDDGKLNLSLAKPRYGKVPEISDTIIDYLKSQGGFMPVTDKQSSEAIYALFGVSKKTYKKAIGSLYKARKITFENDGTKLL